MNKYLQRFKTKDERFWEKVNKTETCYMWIGTIAPSGYGEITINGKCIRAHRLSYGLFKGPIPKGLFVLHTCDNPSCVRPEHLWLGTQKQNMQDMLSKGRANKAIGENNGMVKLTEKEVLEIRCKHAAGISKNQLEVEYNVGRRCITKIIKNITWRHI